MRTSILVLLVLSAAAPAHAQSNSRIFVEGAFFEDFDSSHRQTSSGAPGGSTATGFQLNDRLSVRFEADIPTRHHLSLTEGAGPFRITDSHDFRAVTYGVFFAGHVQPHKRVDLALLAGISNALLQERYSESLEQLAPNGSVVRRDQFSNEASERVGAFGFGADVAIAMTRHLAVVPEVRFQAFNEYGQVIRPKLAVRWTF